MNPAPQAEARFPATMEGIADAAIWLRQVAATAELSDRLCFALELCLEELGTNVARHGRPAESMGPEGDLGELLTLDVSLKVAGDAVELAIEDNGRPFDVSAVSGAPVRKPLTEVMPGGLGIHLLRSFSDELLYQPVENGNRVIVKFLRHDNQATTASA